MSAVWKRARETKRKLAEGSKRGKFEKEKKKKKKKIRKHESFFVLKVY